MGLNNFRANVLVRVVVLAALCVVLAWSLVNTRWVATPLVCGALMLLSVFDLFRYVERTSRDFTRFLNYVAHHDFSTPVSIPYKGKVFTELQNAYQVLAGEFRRLNMQKAANHEYLEAVVAHIGIALVCLDDQGIVKMMNGSARRLFGVPHLNSARTFNRIDERLPDLLQQLEDGDRTLLSVRRGDDTLQLTLYATTFELLEQRYKLVSFQNIRDELDRQEIDSWQKLIRVLTHEIMNSVTPITSLSRLVRETMIDDSGGSPAFRTLTPQDRDDMLRSVTAIHSRSRGLLDFVDAYRSFARLPAPVFSDVDVLALFERARTLMSREVETLGIALTLQCQEAGLRIHADAMQVEQVLINLLRNAIESLAECATKRIDLRASRNDQGKVLLQVIDSGPGISPEHLDNIFIPFFTTKRSGTGVGLSVSRQIMHANRGLITVRSVAGEGCVFTLKFQ
jgi:two-component system, NtrC family, nitrogen regulation sensor histidine kinase NtrY